MKKWTEFDIGVVERMTALQNGAYIKPFNQLLLPYYLLGSYQTKIKIFE